MPIRIVTTHLEFEGEVSEQRVVMEGEEPPVWGAEAELQVVGKPIPRVDGRERVTGEAEYRLRCAAAGDAVCRRVALAVSACARRGDRCRRAEALAGVRAVLHRFNTEI